ncbi:hypothetical protein PHYBLDRAFT_171297 [Phycomyces blakesleeanus NRRL 1555(-)]|uniref:Uncharacterized protein n=1 Tax=Phycomyces blakesleeanus (strain ATCC 8743b / DSM 1359 / FGSC 10004 / NBRC 33097 / NRRL 1555) TaxID=763407 RepID=A0A162TX85_PHYB8|nr:hypothetical protein PHYBLDRAFT_171297 [Phycomyces blakesleeanus NRRL 1555(-)]OAD70553.1 hypothetical protein PHYBLDRAFT_171297 [Phycomyces blakesleeanus NRRL 1555(-)]|eukprot:XP_018288593.1 hypothetical protein PHYBLDRAFT_171297 [Phycomyces blakesleeanus NRRL 1555(-)]
MPTSNNSLEFVMDKHCKMVSHSGSADQTQFSGIAFDPLCDFNQEIVDEMHGEVVLRSVTDVFVNHADMEWTHTSAGNPAVTNLLSLKSFLPTEVNEATTKTIVAQKPKTNLLEKVDPDSVPTAESIHWKNNNKYTPGNSGILFGVLPISTGTKADLVTCAQTCYLQVVPRKLYFKLCFFAVIQSVSMLKVNNQGLRRMCIVELSLGE